MIEKQLSGFDWCIWFLYADRDYLPNRINSSISLATGLSYVVFMLAILFHRIFPGEWFSIFYVFLAGLITVFNTIEVANEHVLESAILLILSASCEICQFQWGFEVNGVHFEPALYHLFIAGGLAALLRRTWNAAIWRELHRIINNAEVMK